MSIQAVGGDASWSRFLALSEAARVRNTGFEAQTRKTEKTGSRVAMEYARTRPAAEARRNNPAQSADSTNTRILGSQFDAYA
jgi:hypothetical protein